MAPLAAERATPSVRTSLNGFCRAHGVKNPGLLLLPRYSEFDKGAHDPHAPCTGPGFSGGVTIDQTSGEGNFGCLLSTTLDGRMNLDWSDGTTSNVDLSNISVAPPNLSKAIILQGTITSGKFDGHPAKLVLTSTSGFTLDCLTEPGFEDFSGHIALTVGI
jgi:hypothetical protein